MRPREHRCRAATRCGAGAARAGRRAGGCRRGTSYTISTYTDAQRAGHTHAIPMMALRASSINRPSHMLAAGPESGTVWEGKGRNYQRRKGRGYNAEDGRVSSLVAQLSQSHGWLEKGLMLGWGEEQVTIAKPHPVQPRFASPRLSRVLAAPPGCGSCRSRAESR